MNGILSRTDLGEDEKAKQFLKHAKQLPDFQSTTEYKKTSERSGPPTNLENLT